MQGLYQLPRTNKPSSSLSSTTSGSSHQDLLLSARSTFAPDRITAHPLEIDSCNCLGFSTDSLPRAEYILHPGGRVQPLTPERTNKLAVCEKYWVAPGVTCDDILARISVGRVCYRVKASYYSEQRFGGPKKVTLVDTILCLDGVLYPYHVLSGFERIEQMPESGISYSPSPSTLSFYFRKELSKIATIVQNFLDSERIYSKSLILHAALDQGLTNNVRNVIEESFPWPQETASLQLDERTITFIPLESFEFAPLRSDVHLGFERACDWFVPTSCDDCYTQGVGACSQNLKLIRSISCHGLCCLSGVALALVSPLCCLLYVGCCCFESCCSLRRVREFDKSLTERGTELRESIYFEHSPVGILNCPNNVYLEALSSTLPTLPDISPGNHYFLKLNNTMWSKFKSHLFLISVLPELPIELIRILWLYFLCVVNEITSIEYFCRTQRLTG